MRLDKKIISEIRMGGKGGGEKVFAPALIDFRRINKSLYDFFNDETQERVELKKQKNLQWFDGWKYHRLSSDDKSPCYLCFTTEIEWCKSILFRWEP